MVLRDFLAISKVALGFLLFDQNTRPSLFFKKAPFEAFIGRPWPFGKKPVKSFLF